jgi:hypothetical protein
LPARYWFSSAKLWLASDAVLLPVADAGSATVIDCGAEVATPLLATRSLIWLNSAKPWFAGDAVVVEAAAGAGSVTVIGFGTVVATGLETWSVGTPELVEVEDGGFVTVAV